MSLRRTTLFLWASAITLLMFESKSFAKDYPKYRLGVQVFSFGPNYRATMAGVRADIRLFSDSYLALVYQAGLRFFNDTYSENNSQNALSAYYKANVGGRLYVKSGLDYRTDHIKNKTNKSTPSFRWSYTSTSLAFDVSLGSQFDFSKRNISLEIDWLGVVAPLSSQISNEVKGTSFISSESEEKEYQTDVDDVSKDVWLVLLRTSILF